MFGAVGDAAGEKIWETTGIGGYHRVRAGARCVARKRTRGLAEQGGVPTSYGGRSRCLTAANNKQITMAYQSVIEDDSPGALVEFCGISILERRSSTLQHSDIQQVTVLFSAARSR